MSRLCDTKTLILGYYPLRGVEDSSLPLSQLYWSGGMVDFPSFRIMRLQGVDELNITFTLIADGKDVVTTIKSFVKPCRTGSIPAATGACTPCPSDYFGTTGISLCQRCVYGAKCVGGRGFPGGMGVYALPEFWQPDEQREGARRALPTFSSVHVAWPKLKPTVYPCPFIGACVNNSKCAAGYQGVLCAICAPGWQFSGPKCVKCESSGPNYVIWIAVFVFVLIVAAAWYVEWSSIQHIKMKLRKVEPECLIRNIFNLFRS